MSIVRGLVFDFDGLILDTELPSFRAWQQIYLEHGAHIEESDWHAAIGTAGAVNPYTMLVERATKPVGLEADVRKAKTLIHHELIAAEAVLPGIVEWLEEAELRGLGVGVASTSPPDWVEGHLERLGLRTRFHVVSCWAEPLRPKPAPDVYTAALESLGVGPHEGIAVEDSPNGVRAAKAAGLFCVAVPNPMTKTLDLSAADVLVPSLAELPLPDLLDQLDAQK